MKNAVDALAIQAKDNPALMADLWQAVQRLVALWANRYCAIGREQGSRLFDCDDLIQCGYLALVDAVEGFRPDIGATFISYFRFHIRRHFAECAGRRGTRKRAEWYADSLDAPISEDNDSSRMDYLADPEAHFAYEDVDEWLTIQAAYDVAMRAIEALPEQQQQAIRLSICDGLALKDVGAAMDCSPERVRQCRNQGLRVVRSNPELRRYQASFQHVSFSHWRLTHTSAVELEVIRREKEWLQRYYAGEI